MAAPVFGTLGYYLIMLVVTCFVISGIFMLINSITCSRLAPNIFEHFEDSLDAKMTSQAASIAAGIQSIQKSIETLDQDGDDVCRVLDYIESGYVGDKSGASDESEYKQDPEEQKRLTERRKKRANSSFKEIKAQAGPLIECFSSESNAYDNLLDKVNEYNQLINSSEYKAASDKLTKLSKTVVFNAKYLGKAATFIKNSEKPLKEGFEVVPLSSNDLSVKADKIIAEISSILNNFTQIHSVSIQQTAAMKGMMAKQNEAVDGSKAGNDFDIKQSKPPKPSQYVFS